MSRSAFEAPRSPSLSLTATSVPVPDFDSGMTGQAGGLDQTTLEEALRNALKSVLGGVGSGANPRVEFYNKFQREIEEHDRDFDKKYDEDLNTTLIFAGLFSAVTSAFIIDIQSELKPDYQEMNNALLEMLLNATTGSFPAGSVTPIPRWSGPDPVVVQVQCILYATLFATLLAAFLAMLGKQWLNRYRQSETRGSTADRCRVRERKLTGIETWKFHVVMESLPLILQCALILLGFALSRYLWEINRSVSSVVIGFACFGFLFYLLIATMSVLSFDCPFQTPFSLLIRFAIGLVIPYWRNVRQAFGPKQHSPQSETLGARLDLPLSMNVVGGEHELEASITALACIAPAVVQFSQSVTPLFIQELGAEGDRLDARCINRMFKISTDADVITSIMDFIPEVIWHSGIKDVPFKRIHNTLMDCFDLSGPHPVVIPKWRDVAYLSARAFVHIGLQRRCITQYEEHERDSWKALHANHPLLSPTDYSPDPDLAAVLFMVDMTLGYDNKFPWRQTRMTPLHREWMSHVFLYYAWHEGQVSEVVMDFAEDSMSLKEPSPIVITDCLFIAGLMIGIPFHVSDITTRDKSREMGSILVKVFKALTAVFSASIQIPSALHALRLVTRLPQREFSNASYELFKTIMVSDNLTDQHWEASRLAIYGAFHGPPGRFWWPSDIDKEEPKEILKFLDHHLGLQGAGVDHGSSIALALEAPFVLSSLYEIGFLTFKCTREFNWGSPSLVRGVRSIMHPDRPDKLREGALHLVALISDLWFNSSMPIMEPEEMSEFCEHLAMFVIDSLFHDEFMQKSGITILFGMLRSPVWREHIFAGFWSMFAYFTLVKEEQESARWCLQNAIELLEFTRGLSHSEGLKWWYGTLWFHYGKLDPTVRDEVKKIAVDMLGNDGLSDLNLYLSVIGQVVARIQEQIDELSDEERLNSYGMELRARLVALEGNYHQLGRITGKR